VEADGDGHDTEAGERRGESETRGQRGGVEPDVTSGTLSRKSLLGEEGEGSHRLSDIDRQPLEGDRRRGTRE